MNYKDIQTTNKANQANEQTNFKKLFNLNNVLSQVMNFMAYFIAMGSALLLIYISFIEHLDIKIDWAVVTVFIVLAASISWVNWNAFYRQRYERTMAADIAESEQGKYSIHSRYYYAIKDWDDAELQAKIDEFNETYEKRWLSWVEHITGCPIETQTKVEVNDKGEPVIDEVTGKPKIKIIKGIKDLPYKGFKYPRLMWRVKTHHYPQSGYKTSMELMSLLSFQDNNLNKRDLKAAKKYYHLRSFTRLITSFGMTAIGASIIPDMINGDFWGAILRLMLALGALFGAIVMGTLNGVKGARIKLSTVEDVCGDLERWSGKKSLLPKYKEIVLPEEPKEPDNKKVEATEQKDKEPYQVIEKIFSEQTLPNQLSISDNSE